jgi:putative ABC transport system permease protein
MNIGNLFKISMRALINNKLRAFLTMLGIIIGVASVITMLPSDKVQKSAFKARFLKWVRT